MAVKVNRMKNPDAAKNQQEGAIRFFLQQELARLQIINRLKNNLKGTAVDGTPYIHDVTGNLKNSIKPSKDGPTVWGKNITSRLKVDSYLGLGIGIDQVSVRIDMEKYGDVLDQGEKPATVNKDDIKQWIIDKSRRYPSTEWYLWNPRQGTRYFSGSQITDKIANALATPITKKINTEGVRESGWLDVLKGNQGLNGALQRAFSRYINEKYDDFAYAVVNLKLQKMLSKL
jgi:hypothetical protein